MPGVNGLSIEDKGTVVDTLEIDRPRTRVASVRNVFRVKDNDLSCCGCFLQDYRCAAGGARETLVCGIVCHKQKILNPESQGGHVLNVDHLGTQEARVARTEFRAEKDQPLDLRGVVDANWTRDVIDTVGEINSCRGGGVDGSGNRARIVTSRIICSNSGERQN